jgi:hypothetical protein
VLTGERCQRAVGARVGDQLGYEVLEARAIDPDTPVGRGDRFVEIERQLVNIDPKGGQPPDARCSVLRDVPGVVRNGGHAVRDEHPGQHEEQEKRCAQSQDVMFGARSTRPAGVSQHESPDTPATLRTTR